MRNSERPPGSDAVGSPARAPTGMAVPPLFRQPCPGSAVDRAMMLHPKSDEVRKSMFETLCHSVVACTVVIGATILAVHGDVDSAAWAGACATAIATSGAVTVARRAEVDRKPDPPPRETPPLVVVDRRHNGENLQ